MRQWPCRLGFASSACGTCDAALLMVCTFRKNFDRPIRELRAAPCLHRRSWPTVTLNDASCQEQPQLLECCTEEWKSRRGLGPAAACPPIPCQSVLDQAK